MHVTWLGQAGLYIEACGLHILADPYLSDSVGETDASKHRRVPVDERFLTIEPDVLILTHDHLDHYDPATLSHYMQQSKPVTVLSPQSCWQKVRSYGGGHNYVLFNSGVQWTEGEIRFSAVPAVHSDPCAVGVTLEAEGKCLYITGDTLYSQQIFPVLPPRIDVIFLPINGVGNNMNAADAARFAKRCGAKLAVPVHFGLFDDIDPSRFAFEPKVIPEIFKEIKL